MPELPFKPGATSATLPQDESSLARAAELSALRAQPPAQVAGYDVQRCLGEGAYGSVWLAAEQNTGKLVAIKFYSHRGGVDWSLLNREVEKLAVLYTSRDIIGLLQVGWDADAPYYVMEYLENGSLANLLAHGALSPAEAVRIVTAVTRALKHAHKSGILHCDLKPENVLLDGDLNPRLADFGQSRLSHEQSPALGTLFYMAPEQADLNAIPDPRWDVYALGALFYHTLCGEPPYRSAESERLIREAPTLAARLAVYRNLIARQPRPTAHRHLRDVDRRLVEIIDRCLEVDPAKRFPDADAVDRALDDRLGHRSRRPLMALLIALPLLLFLGLFPVVHKAMTAAAAAAERNLASRALESDVISARILALALDKDLERRKADMYDVAREAPLRTALAEFNHNHDDKLAYARLDQFLTRRKAEVENPPLHKAAGDDEDWFLTDFSGRQIWRKPFRAETHDGYYAWRDYFHGRGSDFDPANAPPDIAPLRATHVSRPFRSLATQRLVVAISVPVFDDEDKQVLGVLSRTIEFGKFLTDYRNLVHSTRGGDNVDRSIALVDVRTGNLLDHPWMTPENLRKLGPEGTNPLAVTPGQRSRFQSLDDHVRRGLPFSDDDHDSAYSDPVSGIDAQASREFGVAWLAAFWPVGDTGWVAIVQEHREDALRPVRNIHDVLMRYAYMGVAVCAVLIAVMWAVVMRGIERRGARQARRLRALDSNY